MSLTASAAASGYPRYADIGIITLAPDKWGDLWMGRHQIAARLTEHFHGVWMNPPHHWRHTGRRFFDRSETVSQPHGTRNLLVYQPEAWLPRISRDGRLSRLLWRARIDRAKNILRSRGCRRFVLYLWRPRFANAANAAAVDLVCYHIADEYSFSDEEVPITPREAALIAEADRVFVVSEALMNKKGHINPATFLVPNGVDFDAYSSDAPEPTDLRVIPRPRVGYTGYLKKQLDWELLEHLAESHPEWSFVFVGQTSPDPTFDDALRRLRQCGNVHFLGPKSTEALTAYPQHFDVCIMPYRSTAYTRYINPLKLNEYLASGRPVVSTRIPAVERMHGVIALASSPSEWSAAIRHTLDEQMRTPARTRERQARAREHDWNRRVELIARLIVDGLDHKRQGAVAV